MKKIYKIFMLIIGLILITGLVYAYITTASSRKSTKLPWQGTPNTFYDSAHNVGTSYLAQLRFTNNNNGTISDSVTGLMGQQVASTSEQTSCKALDTNSFTDTNCNDGTVGDDCNWCAAKSYCADLILGGYTDWRLPTLKELSSIVDLSRSNPSIDTTYFTAYSSYYWSSTTYATDTSRTWRVDFNYGYTNPSNKAGSYYVLCIR